VPETDSSLFGQLELEANRSVRELVAAALRYWPGSWEDQSDPQAPHEASHLNLVIDKGPPSAGLEPPLGCRHHRGAHRGRVPAGAGGANVAHGLLPGRSGGV